MPAGGVTPNFLLPYPISTDAVEPRAHMEEFALAIDTEMLNFITSTVTSTDNAIVRFDGVSGDFQNSIVTVSDTGDVLIPGDLTVTGSIGLFDLDLGGDLTVGGTINGGTLSTTVGGTDNTAYGAGATAGNLSTGSSNTAFGSSALNQVTTSNSSSAFGKRALYLATGQLNTGLGGFAGDAITSGASNTMVGANTDGAATASYQTAIGAGVTTGAAGAVAIGTDSGGVGASTSTANEIMLGTTNHTVRVPGTVGGAAFQWQSYSCTWSSSGGAPAVGNGNLYADYFMIGDIVFYAIRLVIGTTTTFGTGTYTFSLPVDRDSSGFGAASPPATIRLWDSSANKHYIGTSYGSGTTAIAPIFHVDGVSDAQEFSSTVPVTLASGDDVRISGFYQANTPL